MVVSKGLVLKACGFLFERTVVRTDADWVDCVGSIKCDASNGSFEIRSAPFWMSLPDMTRLSNFVAEQQRNDCKSQLEFGPLNFGLQFIMIDPDDLGASIRVLLNVDMCEGQSVYAG